MDDNMPHALVIDDNEVGIQVLAQLLEVSGVTFTALQDPRRVVDVIDAAQQFDVVFLDLEMPRIDGYGVLQFLKVDIGLNAPVIAYTVNLNEMAQAQEVGFDGFLGKPLRKDRFPGQLRRILNGKPVWEAD
jgi:two-component system, cell cycle response regulator DivK